MSRNVKVKLSSVILECVIHSHSAFKLASHSNLNTEMSWECSGDTPLLRQSESSITNPIPKVLCDKIDLN